MEEAEEGGALVTGRSVQGFGTVMCKCPELPWVPREGQPSLGVGDAY